MQKFVAADWPLKLWTAIVVAGWLIYLIPRAASNRSLLTDWQSLLLLIAVAVASLIVAAGLGLILGSLLVSPIYRFQASRNGAPFEPGDQVCILTGRARGRVVKVYSTWQGSSVRVELGEAEKTSFKDIFGAHQLQRVRVSFDKSSAAEPV